MNLYTELAINSFITLLVILDPLGLIPIFSGLCGTSDPEKSRRIAARGILIGGAILFSFALFGDKLLGAIGISISAFRAAGGAMLFMIGLEMVFQKRTERRAQNARMDEITARPNEPAGAAARARAETDGPSDVSIFPLAMPLIAGPGAITSVMLMMGRARGDYAAQGTILAMLLVVLVITYLAFLSATRLNRWMGPTFGEVLTRLLGIILAAVGVEYMVGGLRGVWISLGG